MEVKIGGPSVHILMDQGSMFCTFPEYSDHTNEVVIVTGLL